MWQFLNANAGAIQAVGSIVTAAVTVALVIVTWRYVHLTQRMADVARQQLVFHEEAEAEKWRELNAHTKLLRALLAALPPTTRRPEALARQAVSWEASDVARLQRLAARLDRTAGERAATVVAAMTWLGERLREIKEIEDGEKYDWSAFPWDRWEREITVATRNLDAIAGTVAHRLKAVPASRPSRGDMNPDTGDGP
ncbi:MAG: hypothetical protein ACM3NQ_05970 [Bacteroidales bacterium]